MCTTVTNYLYPPINIDKKLGCNRKHPPRMTPILTTPLAYGVFFTLNLITISCAILIT